jgi:hypothetical protein
MAELLNSGDGGITAETTTGDDNKTDEMADKIQRFRDGQTQILCATKGKEYVCSNCVADYFLTFAFPNIKPRSFDCLTI